MNRKKKILLIYGTRPEAIKMAPLYHQLKDQDQFDVLTCVSAQHRSMLDSVLSIFDITPEFDLDLMKKDQTLFEITSNVLIKLRQVFDQVNPDIVLVHGDTTTAMSASLAAFYSNIKVGHVEAGLRTNNIKSPYPEELNRQIITRISNFHFAPTKQCANNIEKENCINSLITVTGNTVIDSLYWMINKFNSNSDIEFKLNKSFLDLLNFDVQNSKYVLITGHRRENFGDSFINICKSIKTLAIKNSGVHFVYPVHLNPNVQKPVHSLLSNIDNIHLIDPLEYDEFVYLMSNCFFIMTDSGGIQEEAPSLRKPVLVMRDTTERPEAIESGGVKLVGSKEKIIVDSAMELLNSSEVYLKMCIVTNPYGDGTASNKISKFLKENL